jgi:hypothetical protein
MELRNVLADRGFVHILGPSPAIVPGEPQAWDGWILESCDIFKDEFTYYWYYHARGDPQLYPNGYRVGVATAPTPLGPWTRYEGNPILDYGGPDSWDARSVDCVCVMKEGAYDLPEQKSRYYMWYSAAGPTGRHIGLATASSPLGPWQKYEGNPVIRDFGYLCSVVKVNGKFHMYAQYPVAVTDQGPFCVATADRPEGPWTKYEGNPIVRPGDWGAWDDGGYSEAGVRYDDGVFHWFYGGTKTQKLESIGYAYSFDGFHFVKYSGNPIIPLQRVPDASGFAEVKHLIEPPFVYLYHTLRYASRQWRQREQRREWATEHLGIQVLSLGPTFRIPIPLLQFGQLPAGETSRLEQCCPISLENASGCALTVEGCFAPQARAGLTLRVRSSCDGIMYDTRDLCAFEVQAEPGERVCQTVELAAKARFLKVLCENRDEACSITEVRLTATVAS